jgi:threonine aldolase
MKSFGSDNHSGVHPAIMKAIADANVGHAASYGQDAWTEKATATFRKHFGDVDVFFVFNGTAANVLALAAMVQPHHSIICSELAHLTQDECGAPERFLGAKLISVPHEHGRVRIADVEKRLVRRGDQHFSQPRVLSLTQPTELGTTYSLFELRKLCAFAHDHDLLVHMDGSRLVNAAVSLGVSLGELTQGVDALSFGGTKNGLLFGEAIVLFRKSPDFRFIRKQAMQLASKQRFIAAQFEALLGGDLWQRNAYHVLSMAKRLEDGVRKIPGVRITRPVDSNAVFAEIPWPAIKKAREKYFFYVWDEHTGEVRWMTSFDTTPADVDDFIATLSASVA